MPSHATEIWLRRELKKAQDTNTELLAALEEIATFQLAPGQHPDVYTAYVRNIARAAIAKARGERS